MIDYRSNKNILAVFFFVVFCCGGLVFISACENRKADSALDAQSGRDGKGSPSGKPTNGLPNYDPRSFSNGQTWIWKARNINPLKRPCQRWQILGTGRDGMTTIEHRESLGCEAYENSSWRRYLVNMNTGEILRISYSDDTPPSHSNANIFSRLNGDDSAHPTSRKEVTFNKQRYQAVQAVGTKSWYLDAPETPLHAVLFQDEKWDLIFASK